MHERIIVFICVTVFLSISADSNGPNIRCKCPREFKPLCGTDGYTYNSDCLLKCAQVKRPAIRVAYQGICCPEPYCPSHLDPVCDNIGHTHDNQCMFRYVFCVMRKSDNVELRIVTKGSCEAKDCQENCSKMVDPVCDTSGGTHKNLCMLENANCLLRKAGRKSLLIAFKGHCISSVIVANINSSTAPDTENTTLDSNKWSLANIIENARVSELNTSRNLSELEKSAQSFEISGIDGPLEEHEGKSKDPETEGLSETSEPEEKPDLKGTSELFEAKGTSKPVVPEGTPEPANPESLEPKGTLEPFKVQGTPGPQASEGTPEQVNPDETAEPLEQEGILEPSKVQGTPGPEASEGTPEPAKSEETSEPLESEGISEAVAPEGTPEPVIPEETSESLEPKETLEPFKFQETPEPEAPEGTPEQVNPDETAEPLEQEGILEPFEVQGTPGPEASEGTPEPAKSEETSEPLESEGISEAVAPEGTPEPVIPEETSEPLEPKETLEPFKFQETPEPEAPEGTPEQVNPDETAEPLEQEEILEPFEVQGTPGSEAPEGTPEPVIPEETSEPLESEEVSKFPKPEEINLPIFVATKNLLNNPSIQILTGSLSQPVLLPVIPESKLTNTTIKIEDKNVDIDKSGATTDKLGSKIDQLGISTDLCSAAKCTKENRPVCDSNGKTHRNICLFQFYVCKQSKKPGTNKVAIRLEKDEACNTMIVNIVKHVKPDLNTCHKCDPGELDPTFPVCDNTNRTHETLCDFNEANCLGSLQFYSILVHFGSCHRNSPNFPESREICPDKCSDEEKSVCDNKGMNHRNLCFFQMTNCRLRKSGRIPPYIVSLISCEMTGKPVDGESKIVKIEPILNEQIECPRPNCGNMQSALCDNEGKEHRNSCMFAWARCTAAQQGRNLTLKKQGSCDDDFCTNRTCNNISQPICGTDFRTYSNECYIRQAQCDNFDLEILFQGECRHCLDQVCPILGPESDDSLFICDQNDESKPRCEFDMVQCIYQRKMDTNRLNITEKHLGRCCSSATLCPRMSSPVCDTRRRTFSNRCLFQVEQCRMKKLFGEEMQLLGSMACDDLPLETVREAECQQNCTSVYQPVCATNGRTYVNQCLLDVEKCRSSFPLELAYQGQCCDVQCPNKWSPVCASDGVTHENYCEFGKARCIAEKTSGFDLQINSYGICENSECTENCQTVFEPICANNGQTYVNRCEFRKALCVANKKMRFVSPLGVDYEGQCCDDIECSYRFEPVCDTFGRTHTNRCVFNREKCTSERLHNMSISIQYPGPCCVQPCTEQDYEIVCDGKKSYRNMCLFRIGQCEAERRGEHLMLSYRGECCQLEENCPQNSTSICDSDEETHVNPCSFRHKQCLVARQQNRRLNVLHDGPCCTPEVCTQEYQPICDSTGVTHSNKCQFENNRCRQEKMRRDNRVEIAYQGECCDQNCPTDWAPVCDQHGDLHDNKCHFDVHSCRSDRKSGSILMQTPCPARLNRRFAA